MVLIKQILKKSNPLYLATSKQMTYMFDIWRLFFCRALCLASAAVNASSWNGFGCAWHVRPLQVLVCVWMYCAVACPVARWHVKLRQAGATLWALGALAANVSSVYDVKNGHTLN